MICLYALMVSYKLIDQTKEENFPYPHFKASKSTVNQFYRNK
ncbi:hypothetical protein XSR1_60148 [Xenorhabdus szentirmaii DSM 16338]|uniref:Uncharacterized protein n=1 Tax=Xenorhabdus szentirmaii DSM 16338 TaxID=1427518 RepID=W1J304_9GAMM|nr:hypothetical protein XSR1_60148 [Xenorhabdus szentirmaii DSM 16338]